MIIPDYLIIDEIKRREEKQWQPETHQIPLYIPEPEPQDYEVPRRNNVPGTKSKRENGAIVIDLIGNGIAI